MLKRGSIPIAVLLVLVVLLSASSGLYAGASFFAQQAPVTVTTTILTTTTSWTTSTLWSTVTAVVLGVWTTVQYTTSTSTVTVTGSTTPRAAKAVTAYGNARISTAQSRFGGASGVFNGNGAYLSTPDSVDWAFGAGDFTIDFWVRFNAIPTVGNYMQLYIQRETDGANEHSFSFYNDGVYGQWRVYVEVSGSLLLNIGRPSHGIVLGTWYHIAYVRSGNNLRIFENGVQCGTDISFSSAMPDAAIQLEIGRNPYSGGVRYFNGWLDEFRVSKGVARWTSNFTPPTSAPTGDSNTVLLLHMDGVDGSNTFIDG